MSGRIDRLKHAVEMACECKATHAESSQVTEIFNGQVVWEGVVESFDLQGHPKATRCYAFHIMEDDVPRFTTVLKIPPVDSPQSAVKVAIASKGQRK